MTEKFSRTVLVLGAGAHVPYGFPTSSQLTKAIKSLYGKELRISSLSISSSDSKEIQYKKEICAILRNLKVIAPPEKPTSANHYDILLGDRLDAFIKAFGESQLYSIDAYLAKRIENHNNTDEHSKIGKLLVSYFVSKAEEATPIGFHEPDWIQYLINNYLRDERSLEQFFKAPPAIYTFNYDNLFEKCLSAHLQSHHGLTQDKTREKIKNINIRHIYGHTNTWESGLAGTNTALHAHALNDMKVIGEDRAEQILNVVSEKFYDDVTSAKTVYFLGFGFDPLNVDLLFSRFRANKSEYFKDINFITTNVGFTKIDIQRIRMRTPVNIVFPNIVGVDSYKLISEIQPIFEDKLSQNKTIQL